MRLKHLYDHPLYYDIASSWQIDEDINVLLSILERFGDNAGRSLLEPACGTGRYLLGMARHGLSGAGYDLNPQMVTFARKKISAAGLADRLRVEVGNMISCQPGQTCDAGFNMVNSFGYLLSDAAIRDHLTVTANTLNPGGVYVIQMSCAWDGMIRNEPAWTISRGGITICTRWQIVREERRSARSIHLCRMKIVETDGQHKTLRERHILRLWTGEQIKALLASHPRFRLTGIINREGQELSVNSHIRGEDGLLYFVLAVQPVQ